jgi:hypothetical protein
MFDFIFKIWALWCQGNYARYKEVLKNEFYLNLLIVVNGGNVVGCNR